MHDIINTGPERPVLFLDIDGVLNSTNFYKNRSSKLIKLDPFPVSLLNDFLSKRDDIDLIISSSWRKDPDCITELASNGFECLISGFTPVHNSTNTSTGRGEEIKEWLTLNRSAGFSNFAIIDDDSDILPEQLCRFILVDGYFGLSPNTIYRLNRMLLKND